MVLWTTIYAQKTTFLITCTTIYVLTVWEASTRNKEGTHSFLKVPQYKFLCPSSRKILAPPPIKIGRLL